MVNNPFTGSSFKTLVAKPVVDESLEKGFTLVTSILLIVFALRPAILTVIDLNLKLATAKQTTKQLTNKIDQLSQAQRNYEAVRADLPVIDAAFPKNPELTDFVK